MKNQSLREQISLYKMQTNLCFDFNTSCLSFSIIKESDTTVYVALFFLLSSKKLFLIIWYDIFFRFLSTKKLNAENLVNNVIFYEFMKYRASLEVSGFQIKVELICYRNTWFNASYKLSYRFSMFNKITVRPVSMQILILLTSRQTLFEMVRK